MAIRTARDGPTIVRAIAKTVAPFTLRWLGVIFLLLSLVVGLQGIEPCLYAPEAHVLPVYDSPRKALTIIVYGA
jgi:hypothetical protein